MTQTQTTTRKPISLRDGARVNAAIAEVEGKAIARTLDANDLHDAAYGAAERRLAGLPKRLWVGTTVLFDPHRVPNSYNYTADSTKAVLIRRTSDWALLTVTRDRARTESYGTDGDIKITLPADIDRDDLLASLLNSARLDIAQGWDVIAK